MRHRTDLDHWIIPAVIVTVILIIAEHLLIGIKTDINVDVVVGMGSLVIGWLSGVIAVREYRKLPPGERRAKAKQSHIANMQKPFYRIFEVLLLLLPFALKTVPILPILYFTHLFYLRAAYVQDEAEESSGLTTN